VYIPIIPKHSRQQQQYIAILKNFLDKSDNLKEYAS